MMGHRMVKLCKSMLLLGLLSLLLVSPAAAQEPTIKELRAKFEGMSREQVQALGYVIEPFCVDGSLIGQPQLGGMGWHAVRMDLLSDNVINAAEPELLLLNEKQVVYGIEYETHDNSIAAPQVLGHTMNFSPPHPGHETPHYMLHIYFNADGSELFADWNPSFKCPLGTLPPMPPQAELPATGVEQAPQPRALPQTGAADSLSLALPLIALTMLSLGSVLVLRARRRPGA